MNSQPLAKPRASQRLFKRHSYFQELHVVYEGHHDRIPLHGPDLSPHGMFINTSYQLPEGAVLQVQFRLSQSNFVVRARCEVRYCLPGVGVGVEFVHISARAQNAIRDAIVQGSSYPEI